MYCMYFNPTHRVVNKSVSLSIYIIIYIYIYLPPHSLSLALSLALPSLSLSLSLSNTCVSSREPFLLTLHHEASGTSNVCNYRIVCRGGHLCIIDGEVIVPVVFDDAFDLIIVKLRRHSVHH